MIETLTCIMCPVGCELEVEQKESGISIRGNQCDKGIEFAGEEVLDPQRNLATSVPILNGKNFKMLSVRLNKRVPRPKLFDILHEISALKPVAPVYRGESLIKNVLNTGADVIATRTVLSTNVEPKALP